MELKQEIKPILEDAWGTYTSFLDDELIDAIIDASISKEPAESLIEKAVGGSSFDWQYAVQTVYDAAEFIATALSIYQGLKSTFKKDPSEEELKKELKKQVDAPEHREEKEKAIKKIVKKR